MGRFFVVWGSDGPSEALSKLGVRKMFGRGMSKSLFAIMGMFPWVVLGWFFGGNPETIIGHG